jgi:hypothetical protein
MKVLGNFRKLIDWVAADANYNPANEPLKVPALEALYTGALVTLEDVPAKLASNKSAINARKAAFDAALKKGRQIRNVMKASGASDATLANLDTPLSKLLGERRSPKIKDDPNTPENEAANQHSASQTSFDNRVGSFNTILAIVGTVTVYNPNEADLKLTALQAFADDLAAKNNAVNTTFVPLSQARATRDQILYQNDNSVVNTAVMVKAYVKGALGSDSHLYQQIKGLRFVKQE